MEISKRLAVPENLGCVALLACQNKRERKKRIGMWWEMGRETGRSLKKFKKVAILMVWDSRCESCVYRGQNE